MKRLPTLSAYVSVLAVLALAACSAEPDGAGQKAIHDLAETAHAGGNDPSAAGFYQMALQRQPDDVVALTNLAAIYEAHGMYADAERNQAAALKLAPDNADIRFAEARLLVRLGRYADARDQYQILLQHDRHDVKALNGQGIAFDYLGQHGDAEASYRAALEEKPDDAATLNNLAHSYVLDGQYEDAIHVLEPHARDKNAPPALRQNLAEAYAMAGMYADAERMMRMDLKPADVKRNLAYYRTRRAHKVPQDKFVADLGSYPTRDMADVKAEAARSALGDKSSFLITVISDVASIGGTPSFHVQATGFAKAQSLNGFCKDMQAKDIGCKTVINP
jgi:Flp pilus assembly protein TadD